MATQMTHVINEESHGLGASRAMKRVFIAALEAAKSDRPLLLHGEPGTGKERLARMIHQWGERADALFVKVSLAKLAEDHIEAELFGTTTGDCLKTAPRRPGWFEKAGHGVVYVERIADFSIAMQRKLLLLCRTGFFQRVGDRGPIHLDARIIIACDEDPEDLIQQGLLLEDLYEDLRANMIRIPPLRERKSDILPLAHDFLRKYTNRSGKHAVQFSASAMTLLTTHAWLGNIDELERCVGAAIEKCRGDIVDVAHLPSGLQAGAVDRFARGDNLDDTLANLERTLITDALAAARGNRARAAEMLGVTERVMGLRVRKYGIEPRAFRTGT